MLFIYNILTHFSGFILRLLSLFNDKLSLGVKGRNETFKALKSAISKSDKVVWFHCASLGEYEQGLPVFEEIKKLYTDHKIVLSFFSPSGYEVRKDTKLADTVIYLPLDTKRNAKKFLDSAHPDLVVFVKYDLWPNYLNQIKKRKIRAILISANFRKDQFYFKPFGRFILKSLNAFQKIFVQNESSKDLLAQFGITHTIVSGDTRFDRVSKQLSADNTLDFIEEFKHDHLCVVAGSTWPEGEHLLVKYLNELEDSNTKFIIAPHNIKAKQIKALKDAIEKPTLLYSEKDTIRDLSLFQVMILDTIGLLSRIYNYADIAYVGGALGTTGLHNTLEAAVFGVPILIGPHYDKFPEAVSMIEKGGISVMANQKELNTTLNELIENEEKRTSAGNANSAYIQENTGAVVQIMNFLRI